MIKIRVSTLPESGLELNEEISSKTVNERLISAPDSSINKIEFSEPIQVTLHVEKVPHGMTAEGQIEATCAQACSRCAEFVNHPVKCPIRHVFKHHGNPEVPLPEDDIGVSFYSGEHVDLGNVVEDLLILNLSPYWHPEDDATGNCLHCKNNFKQKKTVVKLGTQGLGDALKKAGINLGKG